MKGRKIAKESIAALHLYGGDPIERKTDPLYGDVNAYRTMNALLFEGINNEKERIWEEGKQLNPAFLERIEDTINLYKNIFSIMCMKDEDASEDESSVMPASKVPSEVPAKKVRSAIPASRAPSGMPVNKVIPTEIIGKRIDRKTSLAIYEKGYTASFFSTSKKGYDKEFSDKNGIILLEVKIGKGIPCIDFEKVLDRAQYKNIDEREILLPPFTRIKTEKVPFSVGETRIKDMHHKPPFGKYQITAIEFPNYSLEISESADQFYKKIIHGKDLAAECLRKMNHGEWKEDYESYKKWKKDLQDYLKLMFSGMYYGELENQY